MDLLKKVDIAVASMGGSRFAASSGHVDFGASTAQVGYSDAQAIGSCIPPLGQALQAAANMALTVSEVHLLPCSVDLHLTCDRLNEGSSDLESCMQRPLVCLRGRYYNGASAEGTMYILLLQAMRAQQVQDDAVRGLAESLREIVCVASETPHLPVVIGTENVIEAIGQAFLQVASVIDEYARLPFIGAWIT